MLACGIVMPLACKFRIVCVTLAFELLRVDSKNSAFTLRSLWVWSEATVCGRTRPAKTSDKAMIEVAKANCFGFKVNLPIA